MHDASEKAAVSQPPAKGTPGRLGAGWRIALAACAVTALAVLPPVAAALDESFLIGLFTRIFIFALAAVSLDLILGFGGMVSFGHSAYFGAGAYVVGILSFHAAGGDAPAWPFSLPGLESALAVWPLAVAGAALLALLVGAVSLRTTGMYFIMITLAFAQMLYYFFVSLEVYGGDDGLSIAQRNRFPVLDSRKRDGLLLHLPPDPGGLPGDRPAADAFSLRHGGCKAARRTRNGCWPWGSPCIATSWRGSSWPERRRASRAR